jgi:hypothetical protein
MVDKRIMTPGNIPIFNLNEIHYRQAHFSWISYILNIPSSSDQILCLGSSFRPNPWSLQINRNADKVLYALYSCFIAQHKYHDIIYVWLLPLRYFPVYLIQIKIYPTVYFTSYWGLLHCNIV